MCIFNVGVLRPIDSATYNVAIAYLLPLADATRLYDRYADATVLERLYVQPESADLVAKWLVELRKAM